MRKQIITLVLAFVSVTILTAQNKEITKKEKTEIIQSISENLLETYIDLDVARELTTTLKYNMNSNKYKSITNPDEFSKVVTEDLQKVSKDLHLKLNYEPKKNSTK